MQNVDLSDALRYLLTGAIAIVFLYICEPNYVNFLIENVGAIAISLAAITWGGIVYFFYYPIIYHRLIVRLQDLFRIKSDSPRTFLEKRCQLNKTDASILWGYIRHDVVNENIRRTWRREASGVHLMYISSTTAFGFAVWQMLSGHFGNSKLLALIGVLIGLGGFFHDRLTEDYEARYCHSIDKGELQHIRDTFFPQNHKSPKKF